MPSKCKELSKNLKELFLKNYLKNCPGKCVLTP